MAALQAVLVASIAVPLLLLLGAAWLSHLRVPWPGRDSDLFISDTALGEYSGHQQFAVTRYKPNSVQTPSGGMIFVSVGPDYFAGYYRDIVGDEGVNVTMARADGRFCRASPSRRAVRSRCRRATP